MIHDQRPGHRAGPGLLRAAFMLWLLCTALAAGAGGAQGTADPVDRLLQASGIGDTVNQLLPNILAGMEAPGQAPLPPALLEALRESAREAFQPQPMLDGMRVRLARGLDARQLSDTLRWLDAPLGQRITDLEKASNSVDAREQWTAYFAAQHSAPTDARMRLIERLDRAVGADELLGAVLGTMAEAAAVGVNAAQPVERQVPAETIRRNLRPLLDQLRAKSHQLAIATFLFTYRSLDDADLDAYLKFYESPSGVAYARITTEAFRETINEAMVRFASVMPKAIERHKTKLDT